MKKKMVIILGAARSGTHFMSRLLQDNIEDHTYVPEVREVWAQGVKNPIDSDVIIETMFDASHVEGLRKTFGAMGADKQVLIEKTANNVFRLPLVFQAFPDAYYIHIIRDGRDVAISSHKKMMGDIRKKTKTSNVKVSLSSRIKNLITLAKVKARYISAGNFKRYLLGTFSQLGLISSTLWGPRFIGMNDAHRVYSGLELSALQWKLSVDTVQSFFCNKPAARYKEVKFEALIENPENEVRAILSFLGLDANCVHTEYVDAALLGGRSLECAEEDRIVQLVGSTLMSLGYIGPSKNYGNEGKTK